MKKLIILSIALIIVCTGCATQEDLLRVEGRLGNRITDIQKDTTALGESLKATKKSQANTDADTIDLRDSVQQMRGATEQLKVKMAALESKKEVKTIDDKLADISNRLAYLESYLGIDKGDSKKENMGKETSPLKKEETATGKEEAYSNAYSLFKDGKYDLAKEAFRKFLQAFPNTEYSDNAQFWIGECDYFEGRYEEAIVEYEGVIQNYPTGNKVPHAFLKQALAFLKLGDKSSAKLLLQRVIKDYPNTTPARIARGKLVSIK